MPHLLGSSLFVVPHHGYCFSMVPVGADGGSAVDLVAIIAAAVVAGVAAGMQTGVAGVVAGWFRRERRGGEAQAVPQHNPAAVEPGSGGESRSEGLVVQVDGTAHSVGATGPAPSSAAKVVNNHVSGNTNVVVGDYTAMTIHAPSSQDTTES
jgi:hypothetical protein